MQTRSLTGSHGCKSTHGGEGAMDRKDPLVSSGVAYALLKGIRTQDQLTAGWSFLPREAVHNTLGSRGLIHVGEPCFWGTGHVREHPLLAFFLIELRVPWLPV